MVDKAFINKIKYYDFEFLSCEVHILRLQTSAASTLLLMLNPNKLRNITDANVEKTFL